MQYNEVAPFKPTYRAFSKVLRGFKGGEFACILEVTDFIYKQARHPQSPAISYTLKREGDVSYQTNHRQVYYGDNTDYKWQRYRYTHDIKYAPPAEWCIIDSFGHVLTKDNIDALRYEANRERNRARWAARESRWDARERLKTRLLYRKGSAKKIKFNYRVRLYHSYWRGNEVSYHNEVRGHYRYPKTHKERAANYAHAHEYGAELVRAHRRTRYGLPSSWDERPCSAWKTEDSWKHHSKRPKQWIPK